MMGKLETREFDAVIIGAGGAGQCAALNLAKQEKRVAIVSKVFPTRSHTSSAQGGINAALSNECNDDWRWHMYDTVLGSDFLGDQNAIEYMCKHASDAVIELEHMGVPFSRNKDGKIYQSSFGGQTLNFGGKLATRTCAVSDRTGHAILHTLYQKNLEAKTNFYNEWYAVDLVRTKEGGIGGVIVLSIEKGELVFLKARAVVLATGGAGRIFETTTNAHANTGDGLGMVLRAGFPLQDMEMWQFHPTGLAGVGVLISEAARGEGGYLVNKDGERYMERYDPHFKDLSSRDIVSRSSVLEMREGRGCGPKGDYVLLKLDHLGDQVLHDRLPGIVELSKKFARVDPTKDPIPVKPTCHYMMGGIPTNIDGQVVTLDKNGNDVFVDGLYAIGECACVSVHGSNRLGANSLLDIIVFGRAAGCHLEQMLRTEAHSPQILEDDLDFAMKRLIRWENSSEGEDIYEIRSEMQKIMHDDFGVFRIGENMLEGLQKLLYVAERLKHAALKDNTNNFNTMRIDALELDNLMSVAMSTALLATSREESRGAHARIDYPNRDDKNWLKHSICFADGRIAFREVNMNPKEMKTIKLRKRKE